MAVRNRDVVSTDVGEYLDVRGDNNTDYTPLHQPTTTCSDTAYESLEPEYSEIVNEYVGLGDAPPAPPARVFEHNVQNATTTTTSPRHPTQDATVTEHVQRHKQPHQQPPMTQPQQGVPAGPPPAYSPQPNFTQPQQYPNQNQHLITYQPQYPGQQQYPQQYPGYPAQPLQQQQQVAVFGMQQPASQSTPVVFVQQVPYQSYWGYIALACFTLWCCWFLFGLIAFILAVIAEVRKETDPRSSRQLGHASLGISIAGIIIGVIGIIVVCTVVGLSVTAPARSYNSYG